MKITRFEIIDFRNEVPRQVLVSPTDTSVVVSYEVQDNGRTLKVVIAPK